MKSTRAPAKWPLPSPRVRELLRQGAEIALNAPPEWLDAIDQASLSSEGMRFVAEDPVLIAASRRVNRGSLIQWAAANIEKPGAPVPPYVSADMLTNARELLRLGATDLVFNSSRAAQSAAWQLWMNIAFSLTSEPAELRELLEVSARSISDYIDGTMSQIAEFMRNEREHLMRGTHVDRRDLVSRIMEGASLDERQAGQRLGYSLGHPHHAAVIWSEEAETELSQLEAAAQALSRTTGGKPILTVIANAATLWCWIDGSESLDWHALNLSAKAWAAVRMALGSADAGIEGFRRAHLDALNAQRVLGRLRARTRVVHFDQVRLVSLTSHDAEAAQQFITHTLGDLATADPILQRTLLTFLSTGCNATEAAALLHTHRNTLLRRLARAQELLPRPLDQARIHVAAALEALSWTATHQEAT
ncbi:MAG: PucR family transcriptional regulator [Burkholderiales bacterium]|nr:PucR family transcriptional regulator [Burkholderiales bacterium]